MIPSASFRLPVAVVLAVTFVVITPHAWSAGSSLHDFSGIWRLDDQHSDAPADIAGRLRTEKRHEQAPDSGTTGAATTASPSSARFGGHGGGRGMGGGGMGGGHGHGGGNRNHDNSADADTGTAPQDDPPPLLADDSVLNVAQDAKTIRVVFEDRDQLDDRLDGVAHSTLSGGAMVRSRLIANALQISMQFADDVQLRQEWVLSPDGHHLTVSESWTTPAVKQPIVFTRSYDRLDI
ncbi:MAG: hypothetical protein ABI870_12940 [Rhodanobacter sp.]